MEAIYINIPKRQYDVLKSDIDVAVQKVLDNSRWLMGEETAKFASAFGEYCNSKYCLPLANGTDALEIAMRSLNVEKGAGCITVANAGGYTSTACYLVGLVPQYIDILPDSLTMNISKLKEAIQANTKIIVATHLYGNVVNINRIRKILKSINREDIFIIEDCAQAHGAICEDNRVGSLGDIGTFSFYPTKNLGTMGDGGAIVTNTESIYQSAKAIHQYGWTSRYNNDIPYGRNSRMDEIHASILNVKLPYLDSWNDRRRKILKRYREFLPSKVSVCTNFCENSVCHLAILKLESKEKRDFMMNAMKDKEVYCDIHYPILDCDQKSWHENSFIATPLIVSKEVVDRILTLPCFPELTDDEVDKICRAFNDLY